jgi:allantoate deiminase
MVELPADIGDALLARAAALAAFSEDGAAALTRRFLTAAQREASAQVVAWMEAAGMAARIDAIGNVIGRYEGTSPGLPALIVGSHLDTVRDAGRYDGMLGVLAGIACVGALSEARRRLPFAVEVIGFADEEGVRFGTGLLGSHAVAGTFDPAWLELRDAEGVTLAQALATYGLPPDAIGTAARRRSDVLAYLELHIEQGPVLERAGLPVGIVTAINGATRIAVAIAGMAGHAGTVPMAGRRDALAAAAECALAVEARCRDDGDLVGTVGTLAVRPGAINVIPGDARFTVDVRASEDARRRAAADDILAANAAIAQRRGVKLEQRIIHDQAAVPCAPWLRQRIEHAMLAEGLRAFSLPSGAGHDGMTMQAIADIAMVFVRCAGGISHNPAEAITAADAAAGTRVLLRAIAEFEPRT